MNQKQELLKAFKICISAHADQVDKAGKAYFLHPITIAMKADNHNEMVVGLLHDVVEDSEWTMKDLEVEGFSRDIRAAVEALTKLDGEPYEDYLIRLSKNKLATTVKLRDLTHNMDPSRIKDIGPRDAARILKYSNARRFLKEMK